MKDGDFQAQASVHLSAKYPVNWWQVELFLCGLTALSATRELAYNTFGCWAVLGPV